MGVDDSFLEYGFFQVPLLLMDFWFFREQKILLILFPNSFWFA